jgi:branched-chain amino acid transport system permease protein
VTWPRVAVIAFVCACIASPYIGILPAWTPALATTTALIALSLIGLNLIFGMTGMLALGQAAFVALPGYVAGILERHGTAVLPAIVVGIIVAIGVARVLAELFVRLPGIYFAVGTLGFAFVVEGLARAFPSVTGGASGLVFSAAIRLGPLEISSAIHWYVVAVAGLVAGVIVYARLVRGRLFRTLRAIQHDELAAQVLGVEVARMKVRIFTIGSAYSAVAGALMAHYVGVLIPESAGVNNSLEQVAMVMLGGSGAAVGPLLGAFLVQWLFAVTGKIDTYELLLYGLGFLATVMYAPKGLVGLVRRPWNAARRALRVPDGAARDAGRDLPVAANPARGPAPRQGVCLRVEGASKSS